jgi:hypothetical protein
MPIFKSTKDILQGGEEVFNSHDFYNNSLQLPPNPEWDYSKKLQVEDIDIWEVLSEQSGPTGVYASWCPYAEFYMIVNQGKIDSTYYGEGSDEQAAQRLDQLNIIYPKK